MLGAGGDASLGRPTASWSSLTPGPPEAGSPLPASDGPLPRSRATSGPVVGVLERRGTLYVGGLIRTRVPRSHTSAASSHAFEEDDPHETSARTNEQRRLQPYFLSRLDLLRRVWSSLHACTCPTSYFRELMHCCACLLACRAASSCLACNDPGRR